MKFPTLEDYILFYFPMCMTYCIYCLFLWNLSIVISYTTVFTSQILCFCWEIPKTAFIKFYPEKVSFLTRLDSTQITCIFVHSWTKVYRNSCSKLLNTFKKWNYFEFLSICEISHFCPAVRFECPKTMSDLPNFRCPPRSNFSNMGKCKISVVFQWLNQ